LRWATGDSTYLEEEVKVAGAEVGELAHGKRGIRSIAICIYKGWRLILIQKSQS